MTDGAALLADDVLPAKPIRQCVLSLPFALRFLLATDPDALTRVLGIVYRTISADVLKRARLTRATGSTGAVTLIQRCGSALNVNIHFWLNASAARSNAKGSWPAMPTAAISISARMLAARWTIFWGTRSCTE